MKAPREHYSRLHFLHCRSILNFLRSDDTTKPLSSCWGKWRSWIIQIKVPKVLYNTGHKVPEKHVSTSNKYLWNVLKSSYCFPRRTTPSRDKYRDCVLHKFCFKTYLLFSVCEGFGQSSTAPLQLHLSFCIHLFPCPKYLLWASLREISIKGDEALVDHLVMISCTAKYFFVEQPSLPIWFRWRKLYALAQNSGVHAFLWYARRYVGHKKYLSMP